MVWFWCGGSGLYFGTQAIDFSIHPCLIPSLLFYHRTGSSKEKNSDEIHNTKRIIGGLSCLERTTAALIQYS
jgi:hypothetical protein